MNFIKNLLGYKTEQQPNKSQTSSQPLPKPQKDLQYYLSILNKMLDFLLPISKQINEMEQDLNSQCKIYASNLKKHYYQKNQHQARKDFIRIEVTKNKLNVINKKNKNINSYIQNLLPFKNNPQKIDVLRLRQYTVLEDLLENLSTQQRQLQMCKYVYENQCPLNIKLAEIEICYTIDKRLLKLEQQWKEEINEIQKEKEKEQLDKMESKE